EAVDDRTSRTCGSKLSLERGSADHLFRSSLKSSRSTVGIAAALNDTGRVQSPSGNHSNGTGLIENGIDLIPGSDLNRALAFTGMEREPTVGTCAICGRPLTRVGPKGECLRCLADLGFLSASREPQKSESGRRLTPGPLKYDHFEVEVGADGFPVELGAGAMAITYRARDTVLNSTVALKVIDRKVAQTPGVRSRFLREARAAAQIHHPNVARVSDYGVAKVLAPGSKLSAEQTQTGFIGTPAFASPEQFAPSEQTKIDTRSDIYSLGVTFWYLLSGRVPFVGHTLRVVAAKQAEELPLEQLKNTRVPARVIALLQSMLAVDPAKRPQTARE